MAKSLLLNILVDILGNYVEDLTKDNLKLAVWSGTIELFNLKLKSTALDKLNLPVKVVRGCLKKLQLKIPWTNLESKPVSVSMDGMFLEAGPLDLSEISTEDAKRMVAKSRQKKMEKAENAIMAVIHNKGYKRKKKASYIKQLTAKIMDNLEISITNVHIRYEDQDSIPGTIISCGLTIESISFQTTDEQWNPAYFNREGDKNAPEDDAAAQRKKLSGIHKLGQLKNLAVYWNSAHSAYTKPLLKKALKAADIGSPIPAGLLSPGGVAAAQAAIEAHAATVAAAEEERSQQNWERKMQSLIYTEQFEAASRSATPPPPAAVSADGEEPEVPRAVVEKETLDTMRYLLRPPNKITVKMIHRELCTETQPNMDLTVTCTTMQSKLMDDQYRQLRTLSKVLKGLDRRKLMLYHRPGKRPAEDPKAWWHYAYFLATGNYPIRRGKMEVLSDCIAAKKFLVPFWRRNLVNREVIADQVFMQPSDFLESDLAPEIKAMDLEAHLPIFSLIALRQIAAQEAVIEIKRLRAMPAEMKRYVEEHHLDPEKEGGENAKGKFWGIGKIAKMGKKNEFDDFIPGEKKKKGIFKMLFKRSKKKKGAEADVDDSTHEQETASNGSSAVGAAAKSVKGAGTAGAATIGASAGIAAGASSRPTSVSRKPRTGSEDTDGEGDLTDPEEGGVGDELVPLDGDIDLERALGMKEDAQSEAADGGEGQEGELEEGDEEKLMEELRAALVKSSTDAEQSFTSRIKVGTSLSLRVNLGAQTIVTVVMAVRFCSEKRRNLQRYIVELDNVSVRDMVSVKPLFKYIMSTDKSLLSSKVLRRASIVQTAGTVNIPRIEFSKGEKTGDGFADGTAQFNLLFEKRKGDSVEKGNSLLNIKTAPMQIVWNELCIRQLILCFASKSTASDIDLFVQSAVERNKLLSQGIKKFKAELSAPSYKVTNINMEIYAPCILIPERYDQDCGCVRMDTGKLLIQGRTGFAGMSLKLQLLSVNIGIPTKVAQMQSKPVSHSNRGGRTASEYGRARSTTDADDGPQMIFVPDNSAMQDGSYLIKPFDVNVSMDKFTHNKIADTVLSVSVSPRIDAHLDSLNLIRLNYIMKNMLQSMKKQKDPIEAAAKKNAKKLEKERKRKKAEQQHEDGEVEINYFRQVMFCQFSLPVARVVLALSPEHEVEFTVHAIALKYISRIGDVRCVLGLESLTLNDSMRPKSHRSIIWTADGHEHHHKRDQAVATSTPAPAGASAGAASPATTVDSASVSTAVTTPLRNPFAAAIAAKAKEKQRERDKGHKEGGHHTHHGHHAHSQKEHGLKPLPAVSDVRLLFSPLETEMYESDEENAMKDPAEHPIVFSFTSINTTQSPLFQGIQKDIGITWGGICASIDHQSLERFGPFMSEITNNIKTYQALAEEHDKMVAEFAQIMAVAALDNRRSYNFQKKAPAGGLMSPGGTVLPGSVSVRSRGGSLRVTQGLGRSALSAPPPVLKDPKFGSTRLQFTARSMTLDVLQELVQLTDIAPVTIDSSIAFSEFSDFMPMQESIMPPMPTTPPPPPPTQSQSRSREGSFSGSDELDRASPLVFEGEDSIGGEIEAEGDGEGSDEEEYEVEEAEPMESAFRMEFGNISFQMESKEDEMEINAHMTTFSLKDVRRSSEKFVFNTLVSRSDKRQALQTDAASNIMRLQKRDDAEHILLVKLIKRTKALIDIEVVLQDITSYVSVDIFLSCAKLVQENIKAAKAVKKIMKANKKKAAEPTLKTKLALETYARSKRKGSNGEQAPLSEKKVVRNLSVIILNPRLFVLENPEVVDTKAIVSDCKISLYVVHESCTYQFVDHERTETKDSVHVSLRDFQLFVWTNIQDQSMPHQIIEPAGVDIHLGTASENDVTLLKHFKCSTDNFRGRVSLNDIVLTTSILARAKLTEGKAKKKTKVKKDKKKKKKKKSDGAAEANSDAATIFLTLTMYKIDLNIGRISLVLLNDFNNQNVPLFKMCLDQSDFNAEGSKQHMEGSGSLLLSADNYNLAATCWEPIIEPWQPTLIFSKDFNGTRFTLQSENTLQVNISGILCASIHRSKALVAKIGKAGAYGTRRTIFPLIVRNLLGVPVELYDSRTKERILRLTDDTAQAVPPKTITSTVLTGAANAAEQLRSETYADLFDLHLLGPEAAQRLPILQAPLTAGRPKRYLFRHVERQHHHYESIQEEVYENERYNPVRRAWVEPWMSFDYPHYSDSCGNECPDPESMVLPINWRWVDPAWTPDVGVVGVETDEHGWHYESNFVQFSGCRYVRRAQSALDVVRRRRLIRVRAPRAPTSVPALYGVASTSSDTASQRGGIRPRSNSKESVRSTLTRRSSYNNGRRSKTPEAPPSPPPMPMVVFWEVVTKGDESREIIISSGLHVRNEGPCPLEVELLNAAEDEGDDDGSHSPHMTNQSVLKIDENGSVGVPLSQANSDYLRIRPVAYRRTTYEWSESINCKLRSDQQNSSAVSRVSCCETGNPSKVFYFTIRKELRERQLTITCSANVQLFNGLPCSVVVRCSNTGALPPNRPQSVPSGAEGTDGEGKLAHLATLEAEHLMPGTSITVPRLSLLQDVDAYLEVSGYHSVAPLHLSGFASLPTKEHVVWLRKAEETNPLRRKLSLGASGDEAEGGGGSPGPPSPSSAVVPSARSSSGPVDEKSEFSVIVRAEMSETGVLCLFIYSQYLLVDQSNSGIVIHSQFTAECLGQVNRIPSPNKRKSVAKTSGKTPSTPNAKATSGAGATNSSEPYVPDASVVKVVERCTYRSEDRITWPTVAEQLTQVANGDVTECWAPGRAGVAMIQSGKDNTISLGVNRGGGWCHDIPLNSLGSGKFPIEIFDETTKNNYNIALTLSPLKNTSIQTQLLRVLPCYTIVNYFDEGIEILHPSDEFLDPDHGNFFVGPKSSRPWHRLANYADTSVRIRCEKSTASIGTVDLNEIGTTMLVLPRFKYDENFRGEDLIVAHVEVKFSEPESPSYITIVIWRSLMRFGMDMEVQRGNCAYLSVRNETDFPFTVQQNGAVEYFAGTADPLQLHKFDLAIMPGQWLPYGWTDPKLGKQLLISLGVIPHGSQTPVVLGGSGAGTVATKRDSKVRKSYGGGPALNPGCVVDTSQVNAVSVMDLSALHNNNLANVRCVVKTLGNGLVVCIYKSNELLGTGAKMYFKSAEPEITAESSAVVAIAKEVDEKRKTVVLKMLLQGISVSLIAESPQRRELLGIFIDKFETTVRKAPESAKEGAIKSLEVKIRDLQVDNYSECAVYPVLMTSMHSSEREEATRQWRLARGEGKNGKKDSTRESLSPSPELQAHTQQQSLLEKSLQVSEAEEYPCFLQFSAVQELPKGRAKDDAIVKYVGLRVLELKLAVDSSSLLMFYLDLMTGLLSDTSNVDNSDDLAVRMYFQDLNVEVSTLVLKRSGINAIDVEWAFKKAQVRKYFFETMVIHPLKFTLTFMPTSLARFQEEKVFEKNKKLKLLQAGSGIPDIENFEIRLNSFIVHQAMESVKTMKARLAQKVKREIKANLLKIGGNLLVSMSIIGKPAGLMKNIGDGVQAFFYEPYLGSMEGASGFAKGVGKGTGALVGGVASGIVGYTASLVGSATAGVSMVARGVVALSSGDDEDKFLQTRETKRSQFKASRGGVFSGLKQGGMDLFSGVASGVKGLITKPMHEGKKSGALGVMRGMGMGIVGAVVKPVVGITDGVTSVAAGFTKQMLVDTKPPAMHARPARALERANPVSGKILILLPMDVFAAKAQHFLKQIAGQQNEYLASCTLGFQITAEEYPDAEYGLLLSTTHIYLLTTSVQMVWSISFSELSHIVMKRVSDPNKIDTSGAATGTVGFVLYGCSLAVTKTVTCASRAHALRLYGFMHKFAYRMGNPSAMEPLEALLAETPTSDNDTTNRISRVNYDTYIFGFANNMNLPMNIVTSLATESQMIEAARDKFRTIFCTDMEDKDAVYYYYRRLDEAMFTLAMEWKHSHMLKLTPSHCCICLLLNSCPAYAPVQLLDLELFEGRNYTIFGTGDNYEPTSRTLAPCGGAMVLFAYGHPPSLNDAPTVKLQVKTTAFTAVLSSRTGEPNCTNHNGFSVGYLEKARSDYWSKSVINITLQK